MSEEKISITRALKELKLLTSRIEKQVAAGKFVDIYQGRHKDIVCINGTNKNEFEATAKAQLQSIKDLIKRRNIIKSAILISNSKTIVNIANEKYLVVEAIDRKNAISSEVLLLDKLRFDLNVAKTQIEQNNVQLEKRVDDLVSQSLSSDGKVDKDAYNQIADPIYESNRCQLVDPVKVEKLIEDMDKKIDEFKAEVDFVLSESNSRTEIEI